MAVDYNTGIQMKQKELTETFMMISNWKKMSAFLKVGTPLVEGLWFLVYLIPWYIVSTGWCDVVSDDVLLSTRWV